MHFGVPCYIVNLNFCLLWLKNACFCKLLTSRLLGTTHMIKIFPIKPHKEFVFRKIIQFMDLVANLPMSQVGTLL